MLRQVRPTKIGIIKQSRIANELPSFVGHLLRDWQLRLPCDSSFMMMLTSVIDSRYDRIGLEVWNVYINLMLVKYTLLNESQPSFCTNDFAG